MTAVVEQKAFQERMFARIRDQIGELMTDDELKVIVAAAIKKAFFEPIEERDSWGRGTTKPPAFVTLIQELLKDQVKEAARDWVEKNPDVITKALNEVLEKGFYGIVIAHIQNQAYGPMNELANQLRNKGLI